MIVPIVFLAKNGSLTKRFQTKSRRKDQAFDARRERLSKRSEERLRDIEKTVERVPFPAARIRLKDSGRSAV